MVIVVKSLWLLSYYSCCDILAVHHKKMCVAGKVINSYGLKNRKLIEYILSTVHVTIMYYFFLMDGYTSYVIYCISCRWYINRLFFTLVVFSLFLFHIDFSKGTIDWFGISYATFWYWINNFFHIFWCNFRAKVILVWGI